MEGLQFSHAVKLNLEAVLVLDFLSVIRCTHVAARLRGSQPTYVTSVHSRNASHLRA